VPFIRIVPAFFLIALVAGCSVEAILDPEGHKDKARVVTTEEGSVIAPADGLPVSLEFDTMAKEADRTGFFLKAVIRDAQERAVRSSSFGPGELDKAEPARIDVKDLKPGAYRASLTLTKAGVTVSERRLSFFVAAEQPKVIGTVVYPVSLRPRSGGLIQALFTASADAQPFIRWSMDGRILKEARAADGGELLPWTAPAQEGVYSLTMELFPFPPPGGKSFEFQSAQSFMTKLFVSQVYRPLGNDFGPAEDYFSLLHFSGDSVDFGSLQRGLREPVRAEPVGTPKLQLQQGVFGYLLDAGAGFRLVNPPWPVGLPAATPLVFRLRLLPTEAAASRLLFRFVSEGASYTLATDQDEKLFFSTASASVNASVSFGRKLTPGRAALLALTVTPFADSWNVGLEFDDEPIERAALPAPFGAWPNIGELGIGGPGGFIGIIDEFGVQARR
jgi:hypothetical protein